MEFRLHADGKLTGTYEWWIEKRFDDGTGKLIYQTEPLSGSWIVKENTIQITTDHMWMGLPAFQKANGLQIIVLNRK